MWKDILVFRTLNSYKLGKMYSLCNPYYLLRQRKREKKTLAFMSTSRQSKFLFTSYPAMYRNSTSHPKIMTFTKGACKRHLEHLIWKNFCFLVEKIVHLRTLSIQPAGWLQTAFAFLPTVQLQKAVEVGGLCCQGSTGIKRKLETSFKMKIIRKEWFET